MHIVLHPVTLPFDPQIRLSGGPRFSNTSIEDANRNPQSNISWDEAKWEWGLQFVGDKALMQQTIGFYTARYGMAYAWWFVDPFDSEATIEEGTGWVKNASDEKRYLTKIYPDTDSYSPYQRRIRCPIPGTISWGTVPGNPSVNPYTGEVTGATGEGQCSFQFRCPVKFASDFMQLEREPGDAGSTWQILVQEIGKFQVAI